jgi:hypothetical protein
MGQGCWTCCRRNSLAPTRSADRLCGDAVTWARVRESHLTPRSGNTSGVPYFSSMLLSSRVKVVLVTTLAALVWGFVFVVVSAALAALVLVVAAVAALWLHRTRRLSQ